MTRGQIQRITRTPKNVLRLKGTQSRKKGIWEGTPFPKLELDLTGESMGTAHWMVEKLPELPTVTGQARNNFYDMWAKGDRSNTPLQGRGALRLTQL